jgi:hypothetical protein
MQVVVDGAARLSRSCRDRESPSGVYLLRLIIAPDGSVMAVEPRRAPRRAMEPAALSGAPRYLDGDRDPETPIVRCFADAFRRLRFRRFGGPEVAFDYPIVVENLPPSEPLGPSRRCESDEDCAFRPRPPCACPPCGRSWHQAVNRRTAGEQRRKWRGQPRKCHHQHRCRPCSEPTSFLGSRAVCIDQQCTVR